MLEYINSEQGILVLTLVVTALTQLASLLSRSERPTWWGLLPAWFDVTTWPKLLQLIPAVVGAGGAVFLAQLQSGVLPADALLPALKAAGLVLLEYHGGKKVLQSLVSEGKPKGPTAVVTMAGAVALVLLTSCSVLKSEPVQTAGQAIDAACALGLVHSPALLSLLEQQGIPPDAAQWSADKLCQLPAVIAAFRKARLARSVDPGEDAIAAAREAGYL
jgi:hypothetical protein